MNQIQKISAEELFKKKRINKAILGMVLALIAGIAGAANGWFSPIVQGFVAQEVGMNTLLMQIISVLVILGIVEFGAGIGGAAVVAAQGKSVKEYRRVWNVKSSRVLIISAFLSGPVGTGAALVACTLCGATYTYTITALAPVVVLVLSRLFLKERTNLRMIIGVIIVVVGSVISCIAPPAGITNITAGIICAIIAALSWALDAIISAHGYDTVDSVEACTLYRCWMAGIMDWILAIIICIFTGNIVVFGAVFMAAFSSGSALLWLMLFMLGIFGNYMGIYNAYGLSGASRSNALQNAMPFWTIPLGLIFHVLGVMEYAITPLAVVAACCAVVGVVLIGCKPSELFSMRDI